jgi:hypothetical protein
VVVVLVGIATRNFCQTTYLDYKVFADCGCQGHSQVVVGHNTAVDMPTQGQLVSQERASILLDGRCNLLVEDTVVEVIHTPVEDTVVEVDRTRILVVLRTVGRPWLSWV